MEDAILSAVADRIIAMVAEQIRYEVNLVRGAEEEVQKLSDDLRRLTNVLNDAENRRFKDKNVNYWLSKLEQISYEMEDILDEWNYALLQYSNHVALATSKQKVCSFVPSSSCLCLNKVVARRDIAIKIKKVKRRVDQILKEKDEYNFITSQPTTKDPSPESWRVQSSSFIDLGKVHGRDEDKEILVTKLMGNGDGQEELGNLQVVSIVGVGGLGKTTLAKLVYNDSQVKGCFELKIWICVSDPFDLHAIAKGILESLGKGVSSNTNQLNDLFKHVQDSISGKRFLLVLDDVWTEDVSKWESLENPLKCGGVGSKILVTTRNERVAKIIGTMHDDIYHPKQLSNEYCWLLLRRKALFGKNKDVLENFEDIGKKITKKCKGLPLAAETLGSLLFFKNTMEEWQDVLNSEIWEMKEVQVDLFPHLLLSYNELSPMLKRCFSYCAVFLKDQIINVDELIRNWMALGYLGSKGDMEGTGQEYFHILAMHSLFQDFEKDADGRIRGCRMHDIVHDFSQFIRKYSREEGIAMSKTTCRACDPLIVSNVNEFCSLFWEYKRSPLNLCYCLKRLRVLTVAECALQNIQIENLIHLRLLCLRETVISPKDLNVIFQLYNLQTLDLSACSLKEISKEIGNLIHLRHLNLSNNGSMRELPREIGNLIHLKHLDLCWNSTLKELPEEIGNLIHLRHLDLSNNTSLKELPESLSGLHDLRTLNLTCCQNLCRLPEGLGHLTGLHRLGEFHGGRGWNKLRLLKKLNLLTESLKLIITFVADDNYEEMVEDAHEAQLRNKTKIEELVISFEDGMDENEESSLLRMDVIDALEPHPDLRRLVIDRYNGSKLPLISWIVSPLNRLRQITLKNCDGLSSLPPLGKLPSLEEIVIFEMQGLQFVGRQLLGIEGDINIQSSSNTTSFVAFPKLKKLEFRFNKKLKEWEDITMEEEECTNMLLMPRLTHLMIIGCKDLRALPHRLLRKASSLELLDITISTKLRQRYWDKDGSDWKFISQYNPRLQLCGL